MHFTYWTTFCWDHLSLCCLHCRGRFIDQLRHSTCWIRHELSQNTCGCIQIHLATWHKNYEMWHLVYNPAGVYRSNFNSSPSGPNEMTRFKSWEAAGFFFFFFSRLLLNFIQLGKIKTRWIFRNSQQWEKAWVQHQKKFCIIKHQNIVPAVKNRVAVWDGNRTNQSVHEGRIKGISGKNKIRTEVGASGIRLCFWLELK